MRKKLVLAFGLVVCLGLVALFGWHLLPPKPGVTEANFRRLHQGMSKAQVEAILGGPGADQWAVYAWKGDRCLVAIGFIGDETAGLGWFHVDDGEEPHPWDGLYPEPGDLKLPPQPTPFFDQLRRMLPW
jgi:hypothetical protein